MSRIAFMFPGQGAQYKGMHHELVNDSLCREMIARANDILKYDYATFCVQSDNKELLHNPLAQVTLMITSYLWYLKTTAANIIPHFVAGHSLGEFTALLSAGVLEFEEALLMVKSRGEIFHSIVESGEGRMVAIETGDASILFASVSELSAQNVPVYISARNSSTQFVVSGTATAVSRLSEMLKSSEVTVVPLKVHAPFHSPLLTAIADEFRPVIDHARFVKGRYKIVSSVSGDVVNIPAEHRDLLRQQMTGEIRWQAAINNLISSGVTVFVEPGPGQILSGFLKRGKVRSKIISIDSEKALGNAVADLGNNIMHIDTFLSEIITKLVALRNRNADIMSYQENFVRVYRDLVTLQESLEKDHRLPTRSERVLANQMFGKALDGKLVIPSEKEKYLEAISSCYPILEL
ncbi:MAG: ACP S-malonyltransferase [Cytophagales bacterium]|jgi:[acyl-carrier-protein] S-malonyltransferase|nr:ACP S-malonyltransferase [Cytophagales bacterium]